MEVFNNAFDNKHVITIKTILAKYSNGDLPVKSTEVYFINRSIYIYNSVALSVPVTVTVR